MNQLMVVLERWADGKNRKLRIGGLVTRSVGHYQGVPHGAVQVVVVIRKEAGGGVVPHICLHRRSRHKKTGGGKWDIMGGHLEADERILPDKNNPEAPSSWENQELISRLFWETAVREANEEVQLKQEAFNFTGQHLRCAGGIGGFETGFDDPGSTNREISTCYLAFIPGELLTLREGEPLGDYLEVKDTVMAGGKEIEEVAGQLKLVTFEELLRLYEEDPEEFADGISRVLKRVSREPALEEELIRLLHTGL